MKPSITLCQACACDLPQSPRQGPILLFCASCKRERKRDCDEARQRREGVEPKRPARTHLCQNCGIEFKPKATNRITYCGPPCTHAAMARQKAKTLDKEAADKKKREKELQERRCPRCGLPIDNPNPLKGHCERKVCLNAYAKTLPAYARQQAKRKAAKAHHTFTCIICARVTLVNRTRQTCSDECQETANRRAKARSARANEIRALRMATQTGKPYSRKAIFRRDGYTCYLCGMSIDRHLCTPHDGSPTIDHVVALANGGLDCADNVRAAHFICNSIKRDLPIIPAQTA